MTSPTEMVKAVAAPASELIKLLRDTSGIWTEPARIRRTAEAQADATKILTAAEIESDQLKSDARFRLETLEMLRQHNLNAIASKLALAPNQPLRIDDKDWLIEFVESAKDTSDPTIQEIWAKLLAGEMESPGNCSKRTLRMVKSLSRKEAELIRRISPTLCTVETGDGEFEVFSNAVIKRIEPRIESPEVDSVVLLDKTSPQYRRDSRKLIDCGFLSPDETFRVTFSGEGRMEPNLFALSESSARRIIMKGKSLTASVIQGGLLRKMPGSGNRQTITPAAYIEFDAWRLSPEGIELFRTLSEPHDFAILDEIKAALEKGGVETVFEAERI